jgi:hypothetical protein
MIVENNFLNSEALPVQIINNNLSDPILFRNIQELEYTKLSRITLTSRNEALTVCKRDESKVWAVGMKFVKRKADYTRLDYKRNL